MTSHLLAVASPETFSWSPKVGLLMVLCNIFAIYLGTKIFQAGEGTQLPNPKYFVPPREVHACKALAVPK